MLGLKAHNFRDNLSYIHRGALQIPNKFVKRKQNFMDFH